MEEIYEFRLWEKHAKNIFGPNEGKRLGKLTRRVDLPMSDIRFQQIGKINAALKNQKDLFFTYWDIWRRYKTEEIKQAELFLLSHIVTFEPAGEECGTKYDELASCPNCKAGAKQISPLFLEWKRIPKGKDIARTTAGEIIVSRKMVELMEQHSITGAEFRPVRQRPASSAESKDWFQFVPKSAEAQVIAPTKTGINPFDEDMAGEYRCPSGELIGLARLSELWISRSSYTGPDVVASRQFIGTRRGLLRPERFLLISPKVQRIIEQQKLKGCDLEVAHLI